MSARWVREFSASAEDRLDVRGHHATVSEIERLIQQPTLLGGGLVSSTSIQCPALDRTALSRRRR